MRFRMLLLAFGAPMLAMTACAGPTGGVGSAGLGLAQASDRVKRASAAYYATKPMVDLLAGLLPPAYAARVVAAQVIAERAFEAARVATSAAARLAELRKAEAAARDVAALTGA